MKYQAPDFMIDPITNQPATKAIWTESADVPLGSLHATSLLSA